MKSTPKFSIWLTLAFCLALVFTSTAGAGAPPALADDPNPPAQTVKLIFIHHSSGQNWLQDDHGGLGLALGSNNYFVSDTNYGWGPNAIGDRTDIPNWPEWFRSAKTPQYMTALYGESGQNSSYTRTLTDPGGDNEIVLFKSCFPNSNLAGNPTDPPKYGNQLTVGNAKYIYNELLRYFATRQDKLFVVVTAPPVSDATYATNARAFNNWLVNDWLADNNYPYTNVAVFDFYNVLTGPNNHHRYNGGVIEHVYTPGMDTAYYPSGSGDDHPSPAGNQKARDEFVPLLNIFYNRWKAGNPTLTAVTAQFNSVGAQDGWTLESTENSNKGGFVNSGGTTLSLGDDKARRQYRAVLSFDTSSLPEDAWITSVSLKIRRQGVTGKNPFTTHSGLYVDVRKAYFGAASTLAAADFQAGASRMQVGKFGATPATGGWYSAVLGNTTYQWLNLAGATQFRLRFQLGDDDDSIADVVRFYSGNAANTTDRPVLVVKYLVP